QLPDKGGGLKHGLAGEIEHGYCRQNRRAVEATIAEVEGQLVAQQGVVGHRHTQIFKFRLTRLKQTSLPQLLADDEARVGRQAGTKLADWSIFWQLEPVTQPRFGFL